MAARAIWKGVIRFDAVEVPVKLYAAVEDRNVQFRLLDEESRAPVRQRMVNPATGDEVPFTETKKGYEAERGTFVVLEDEELEELRPEPSRDIEITRFVPPAEIDHRWYERPYYLGPDAASEQGAERDYFALAEALARKDREGVARWTMRQKEYVGALRPEGDYLMLVTLRHAGEVIPASALEAPGGRALAAEEVEMAEKLLSALEDDFDPSRYQDDYRGRVLELIAAMAKGRKLAAPAAAPPKAEPESLAKALEASLARATKAPAKGKSPGKKAPATSKSKRKPSPAKTKAGSPGKKPASGKRERARG